MNPVGEINRKQFLQALFAYGMAVPAASSVFFSADATMCHYPQFGFRLRKPAPWVHLSIPRFEHLTSQQKETVENQDWFNLIRQLSGLPVAIFAQNNEPWKRPTAMVAVYANPLPQETDFEAHMADGPDLFVTLFPHARILAGVTYRKFGSAPGAEFTIQYQINRQQVRSRVTAAWGSRFEICLSLEDYPGDGSDALAEFNDVLDSLEVI